MLKDSIEEWVKQENIRHAYFNGNILMRIYRLFCFTGLLFQVFQMRLYCNLNNYYLKLNTEKITTCLGQENKRLFWCDNSLLILRMYSYSAILGRITVMVCPLTFMHSLLKALLGRCQSQQEHYIAKTKFWIECRYIMNISNPSSSSPGDGT